MDSTANIIGLGYVGVVTCLHLGSSGIRARGWDIDVERVRRLRDGQLPYPDPDLLEALGKVPAGRVQFCEAIEEFDPSNPWIICVGTPSDASSGKLDLSRVKDALLLVLQTCARAGVRSPLILLRSTIPPGSYSSELKPILSKFADLRVSFFYFPEFLREGSGLLDSRDPPIAVLGAPCSSQAALGLSIARLFGLEPDRLEVVSVEVAEMLKLASNSFHALKVCFANEIGSLCTSLGVEASELMRHFVRDTKLNISSAYLRPGFAFGGPCLGKDLAALNGFGEEKGLDLPLLKAIQPSNDEHRARALRHIESFGSDARQIGFLGTSFKHGCLDQRSSQVIQLLTEVGAKNFDHVIHVVSDGSPDLLPPNCQIRRHSCLNELLSEARSVVLGPSPFQPEQLPMLAAFEGPILDLMFEPRLTKPLAGRDGFHQIC